MPLESALGPQSGLVGFEEWQSKLEDDARRTREGSRDDDEPELTEEEQERFEILKRCAQLYDDARRAREPYETFDTAWDCFVGNTWPTRFPNWRAKITINKIRAFITFMQAIMTDNKPRISVDPLVDGTEDAADLLRKLVDRDWDENGMQQKLSTFVLYGLIWGTGFMKITYDPYGDGGRGKHMATPVVPYRVFTNRTATCIEDCEYLIHVEEMTMGWVRRNYPTKAKLVQRLVGHRSGTDQNNRDRDFIREGDQSEQARLISAQEVNGNVSGPQFAPRGDQHADDGDEVEIQEFWLRDDKLEQFDLQATDELGQPKFEPFVDDEGMYDLQTVGTRIEMSEIDGAPVMVPVMKPRMVPVMTTGWRPKFPNGRLVVVAAGRVLLRDIANPYQTDGFPWAMWKDYDVGAFYGQGEPLALKDCSIAISRIVSQVYDILEKYGNPSFLLKKGGGVNAASIKNRPGAIIPLDDMDALKPLEKPAIPNQFLELYGILKTAMGEISGVNDSVMGQLPAANTAFATMDQLQESGAAPIRLKVRNLETGITRIGKLRIQLIQQYDSGDRPLRERSDGVTATAAPQPAANTESQFRKYKNADLQGQVEFGIVPISSLSTSPAGTWNRWMTLLDKRLVDRRWWHTKFRIEGWKTQLPRVEKNEADAAKAAAANKAASKGKPGPIARPGGAPRGRPAPTSHVPTREHNASVR